MMKNTPKTSLRALRLVLGITLGLGFGPGDSPAVRKRRAQLRRRRKSPRDAPDLGGVKSVYVEADGHGPTAAAAIDDAIQTAVKQVNGSQTASVSVQLNVASTAYESDHTTDFNGNAFEQVVASRSGGTVTDFKIVKPASKGLRPSWRLRRQGELDRSYRGSHRQVPGFRRRPASLASSSPCRSPRPRASTWATAA